MTGHQHEPPGAGVYVEEVAGRASVRTHVLRASLFILFLTPSARQGTSLNMSRSAKSIFVVCVCEREKEGEKEREKEGEKDGEMCIWDAEKNVEGGACVALNLLLFVFLVYVNGLSVKSFYFFFLLLLHSLSHTHNTLWVRTHTQSREVNYSLSSFF